MRKLPLGRFTLFATSGLLLVASGQKARASGFHIDEQDARSTARGGAVTANPTNASAIYYNPAGIGDLTGLHIDLGASLVAPSAKFHLGTTGAETEAADKVFFLPQAYLSYRITSLIGVGLGFNAPFGLSVSWPETSPGRAIARDVELRTYFITPTVGFNFSRWVPGLSFGAGLDLVPASVRLTRDILFGTDVGSVALGASAFGVGGRGGLLYRPERLKQWSFGLTYRSPVKLDFDNGDVDFDAPPAYRASLPPDSHGGSTSITLPQTLDLGVAFDPIPEWEIEVDGNWVGLVQLQDPHPQHPWRRPHGVAEKLERLLHRSGRDRVHDEEEVVRPPRLRLGPDARPRLHPRLPAPRREPHRPGRRAGGRARLERPRRSRRALGVAEEPLHFHRRPVHAPGPRHLRRQRMGGGSQRGRCPRYDPRRSGESRAGASYRGDACPAPAAPRASPRSDRPLTAVN